jgi:hypothetical protein
MAAATRAVAVTRFVFFWIAVSACAHTVTTSNPPPPPERAGAPYAGRIVLETPRLRGEVEYFDRVWLRRLEILGVTAQITYDEERAVFDLYGVAADSLSGIATVLADPSTASINGQPIDGALLRWLPGYDGCNCGGRAEVRLDQYQMCNMRDQSEFQLARTGFEARLHGRVIVKPPDVGSLNPEPLCPTSGPGYYPWSVLFDLPPDGNPTQIVLALGGGALPGAARIVSVQGGSP